MISQRQLDFFHNILRAVVSRRLDDFLTAKFNRLFCRTDLVGAYFSGANSELLFPEFDIQARKLGHYSMQDSLFWCAYIEALCALGRTIDAARIINEVYDCHWGADTVRRFLALMSFSKTLGLQHDFVNKGDAVFKTLNESANRKLFESLFSENTTVALIGNGPVDNGNGLGKEIDGHDIVIRINNYAQDGFEFDYGSKTDIWVKASFENINHDQRRLPTRMIYYADELLRRPLMDGYLDAMFSEMQQIPIGCFSSSFRSQLAKQYNIAPTTGFTLIFMLAKMQIKYLDVYGFSFLSDQEFRIYKSYEGRCQDASAHNMNVEMAELSKLGWHGRRLYRDI